MPRHSSSAVGTLLHIVPLLAFALAIYLACAHFGVDLGANIFLVPMFSGTVMEVSGHDLFLFGSVGLLFFELIKASNATHRLVYVEHILSTFVFVGFVVLFLVHPSCGNSAFLIMTLISFIDVLAGWTITYRGGLRDWSTGA